MDTQFKSGTDGNTVYVLVKDWGREGLTIHGTTTSLINAQTWARASSESMFAVTYPDLPPEQGIIAPNDF